MIKHPEWSKDAVIYQINTRQFTKEGTFAAAKQHLPRLQALGIDIIWLMPINKIGEQKKKGSLGSPYAVQDYYSVNPEFGDIDSLRDFVREAHKLGFKVILDWVANHTAWDSVLISEHPDWYLRNWKGDFCPTPWYDWDDIIELDYSRPALREYMLEVMKFWVTEVDIDGYRCDVAGFVPTDFWNLVRRELDLIKPVFMLAEWEDRDLHAAAFDMTYGWRWNETMHRIASGKATAEELYVYYAWNEKAFPSDAMRMLFVSNHDKNAWEGTEYEQFGDALDATIVLSVVSEGMPLVYNGQEAGNKKRLEFFDKDEINWQDHTYTEFYKRLFRLKKGNSALWNAPWGARMVKVENNCPNQVFSFVRQNANDKIFAVFNFTDSQQEVTLKDGPFHGKYTDFFRDEVMVFEGGEKLELPAWDYRLYVQQ